MSVLICIVITTQSFFQNIKAFNDFSQLTDDRFFVRVPSTWHVVISDIRGSTKSIHEGRYKDVNLIGAATIAGVCNALGSSELPFVFGGDGSTLVIAESDMNAVKAQLLGLQLLSKNQFGIELRVGSVPVALLERLGAEVWLGKYQLSPGNYTAQFKGDGLTMAESMIKTGKPSGASLMSAAKCETPPNLTGLSCRLDPILSRNGCILSILVKPLAKSNIVLDEILIEFRRILNGNFLSARPVRAESLSWSWPPSRLAAEVATQRQNRNRLLQWISTGLRSLISKISLTFNVPLGPFNPRKYKMELIENSDFKKFDETLRMVIDCTVEQERQIQATLQDLYRSQKAVYGLHRSSGALMTCMVQSSTNNQHIHFIDGGDGGYALAAVQLKSQLQSVTTSDQS